MFPAALARAVLRLPALIFLSVIVGLGLPAALSAQALLPAQEEAAPAATERPSEALLEILRDQEALSALIAELEALTADAEEVVEPDAPLLVAQSFGRRIALVTQEAAQSTVERLQGLWVSLGRVPDAFDGLGGREVDVLLDAAGELVLVIVTTVAVFLMLRRLAIPVYRRMGAHARHSRFLRKIVIYLGSALIDVLVVVGAWAIGYAIALAAFGEFGQIGLRQTLYLNAFVAVEMIKVGMRMLLSPATGDLRIVPIPDYAAGYLARRANVIFSLLGYGQLLVVPIVNESASFFAGRSVSTLIWSVAILYVAWLVVRNRAAVAEWLLAQTRPAAPPPETMPVTPLETTPEVVETMPEAVPPAEPGAETAAESVAETAAAPAPEEQHRPVDGAPAGTAPMPPEDDTSPRAEARRGAFAPLAQAWHWIVLAYLFAILLIVLTRPGPFVFDALWASAKIAVALVVGLLLSGALARAIARGIHLPPGANARLPLLERRLNRFVPHALLVLRLLIVAAVILFALDTMGVIRAGGWFDSPLGLRLTATAISVAAMLLVAFVLWLALTSWVDYRLNPEFGQVATSREQTLLSLLRNAATIALLVLTLMFVLAEIGLDIGPLLASAGVLGLAIGFGAQKMVQDIITGIFIQFENAINVGDVITAGGTTGVVERLTVRSVSLRDLQGVFHIIPFSSVDLVSNFTREFSFYVCDMGIAYREDVEEAKQAMFDAFDELRRDPEQAPFLLGDFEWFGLDSFGDSAVVLRARIKTLPGKQWGVARAYNGIIKRIFDARGIEIPFPHQTVYFGENKDGTAPPMHVTGAVRTGASTES